MVAHLYHQHFRELLLLGLHGHLHCLFAHLILFNGRFRLIDEKETEILQDLVVALRLQPSDGMLKMMAAQFAAYFFAHCFFFFFFFFFFFLHIVFFFFFFFFFFFCAVTAPSCRSSQPSPTPAVVSAREPLSRSESCAESSRRLSTIPAPTLSQAQLCFQGEPHHFVDW